MAENGGDKFSCASCNRTFLWKPQLAGKRVTCKCGAAIQVPTRAAAPAPAPPVKAAKPAQVKAAAAPEDDDALYAMADMEAKAAESLPPLVMAAAPAIAGGGDDDMAIAPSPRRGAGPKKGGGGGGAGKSNIPLAYRQGPSSRERERDSINVVMDMKRDVYVPVGLLVGGMLVYVIHYAWRYHLGGAGIIATMFGLSLITAFKAAVLIGFALVAAGPLGVSFGGVWTAILKLAAMAVSSDAVITWVDFGIDKISGGTGGGGFFGPGLIGYPVALGLYWGLLIYLFSMDPGDSWMVVVILSIVDYIIRTVLMILLLQLVLGWGGVSHSALSFASGPAPTAKGAKVADGVSELKASGGLRESRQYINDGHQAYLSKFVEAWYAAGAKSVSFEVSRDINGKTDPYALAIELPSDKSKRDACYKELKQYYEELKIDYDPEDLKDTDDPYIEVEVK
jgi:hypothetical protein